jgi:hypothetical protein
MEKVTFEDTARRVLAFASTPEMKPFVASLEQILADGNCFQQPEAKAWFGALQHDFQRHSINISASGCDYISISTRTERLLRETASK